MPKRNPTSVPGSVFCSSLWMFPWADRKEEVQVEATGRKASRAAGEPTLGRRASGLFQKPSKLTEFLSSPAALHGSRGHHSYHAVEATLS